MNNRELLELAATAYFGRDGFEWNSCAGTAGCVQYIPKGGRHYVDWCPLEDTDAAMQLAAYLKMIINLRVSGNDSIVLVNGKTIWVGSTPARESAMAATREAIVSVAADHGKACR